MENSNDRLDDKKEEPSRNRIAEVHFGIPTGGNEVAHRVVGKLTELSRLLSEKHRFFDETSNERNLVKLLSEDDLKAMDEAVSSIYEKLKPVLAGLKEEPSSE